MIAVIGGGSVGLLLASFFAESGQHVTVCTRSEEQARAITEHGLHINSYNGTIKKYAISAIPLSEYAGETDYTIVCVKQHQLESVWPRLITNPHLGGSTIVFTQNGMGHVRLLQQLPMKNIVLSVVEHGALKLSDYEVKQTGVGTVKLAAYQGTIDHLFWEGMQPGSWEVKTDWAAMLHEKLVVNSVINPLTALFGVKNREIADNEDLRAIGWLLCQETCKILKLPDAGEQWGKVMDVCRKTGENKSSMLKDIENDRETEIESISGYLLSQAAHQGMAGVPNTYFVYKSMKALERSSRNRM